MNGKSKWISTLSSLGLSTRSPLSKSSAQDLMVRKSSSFPYRRRLFRSKSDQVRRKGWKICTVDQQLGFDFLKRRKLIGFKAPPRPIERMDFSSSLPTTCWLNFYSTFKHLEEFASGVVLTAKVEPCSATTSEIFLKTLPSNLGTYEASK